MVIQRIALHSWPHFLQLVLWATGLILAQPRSGASPSVLPTPLVRLKEKARLHSSTCAGRWNLGMDIGFLRCCWTELPHEGKSPSFPRASYATSAYMLAHLSCVWLSNGGWQCPVWDRPSGMPTHKYNVPTTVSCTNKDTRNPGLQAPAFFQKSNIRCWRSAIRCCTFALQTRQKEHQQSIDYPRQDAEERCTWRYGSKAQPDVQCRLCFPIVTTTQDYIVTTVYTHF